MRTLLRFNIFLILFFVSLVGLTHAQSASKKVLWVPFQGTVELGLSPYIQRALKYAESHHYDAFVMEMDTFGGRVDAAVNIRDALLDSPVLSAVWINKRAISAGALISFATDKIFFAPGSTMGAATPIQGGLEGAKPVENKVVSYFRAEMGSTAERNGRDRKIGEAMVRADDEIKGLVKKDDVLTLTDKTAISTKISDGTASSQADVLKLLNLEGAQVDLFEINWAEQIVRFLTEPTVSGLLMSGGVLGIIFELQHPGFGLPGIFGIACLGLFFGAKYMVHLAGLEEVFLLIAGLILLIVEIFVLPGFFIFGLVGVILIFLSLFMAGVSPKVPLDFSFPDIQSHVNGMAMAFVLSALALGLIYYWMMKNPRSSPLVLGSEEVKVEGFASHSDYQTFFEKEGVTRTALRPSGKAFIQGEVVDVVSEGAFIEAGEKIKVIAVDGPKLLVVKV